MSSVLLAEDEFLIRAVLVDALEAAGLSCIETATGQAALDVIMADTPLLAIIVDVGLPDISGEKVIAAAIQHRPQTPVIRCSGAASAVRDPEGAKIHLFPKPYSVDALSKFVVSLAADA